LESEPIPPAKARKGSGCILAFFFAALGALAISAVVEAFDLCTSSEADAEGSCAAGYLFLGIIGGAVLGGLSRGPLRKAAGSAFAWPLGDHRESPATANRHGALADLIS